MSIPTGSRRGAFGTPLAWSALCPARLTGPCLGPSRRPGCVAGAGEPSERSTKSPSRGSVTVKGRRCLRRTDARGHRRCPGLRSVSQTFPGDDEIRREGRLVRGDPLLTTCTHFTERAAPRA